MLPFSHQNTQFHFLVLLKCSYLEEPDDYFLGIRGIRYLSNDNIAANEKTGERLIEIYVT